MGIDLIAGDCIALAAIDDVVAAPNAGPNSNLDCRHGSMPSSGRRQSRRRRRRPRSVAVAEDIGAVAIGGRRELVAGNRVSAIAPSMTSASRDQSRREIDIGFRSCVTAVPDARDAVLAVTTARSVAAADDRRPVAERPANPWSPVNRSAPDPPTIVVVAEDAGKAAEEEGSGRPCVMAIACRRRSCRPLPPSTTSPV
jgi:hypothetical protein